MVRSKVCHSDELSTDDALFDIFRQAKGIEVPIKAILIFSDIEKNLSEIAEKLALEYPGAEIVGSSSYGEYSSHIGWQEDSLAVTFFYGDGFSVKSFAINGIGENYESQVDEYFGEYGDVSDSTFCFLFAESLSIGGERIINGIKKVMPETPIIGGLAADRWKFERSHQIHGKSVLTHSVVGLMFFGEIEVDVRLKEGWKPEDTTDRVTSAEGNVVYKIGEKSAFDYYKDWLVRDDAPLGEYPLLIRDDSNGNCYLRAPLLFGHSEDGSIQFAGKVPQGAMVSITRAAPNEVLEAAKNAGEEIAETSEVPHALAVIISCAARRNLLGTRAEMEFIKAKKAMGESVQIIGMHSYGEFFYDPKNKEFESFRNESFCILALRERDGQQDERHP